MAKIYGSTRQDAAQKYKPKNHAKRMSDQIAMALIVYTLLLIFMVTPSLESGMRIWPYFLLVVMVAAVIPFFRSIDHRWKALENSELSDRGLYLRFKQDTGKLCIVAFGIPLILAGICYLLS